MSEVVSVSIVAGAVGACVAAIGVAAGVGYIAYRGIRWLSEQAQRDMERLERELDAPPTHVTTSEAHREFERQLAFVRSQAAQSPSLRQHADDVARLITLRHSPLGSFLDEAQWKKLYEPALDMRSFTDILEQAGKRFTQANALSVGRSIVEVAREAGFAHQRSSQCENGQQTLVLEDSTGRALRAKVVESDSGARVQLDLAGFGDGSCHGVMDRLLSGLAQKGVRLDGVEHRSHYRREGLIASSSEGPRKKGRESKPVSPDKERQEAERRRRQYHSGNHQQQIKP